MQVLYNSVQFCTILYKPINIALSDGGIGRASSTYLCLFTPLLYKPGGRGFDSQWGNCVFLIDIILPAAL